MYLLSLREASDLGKLAENQEMTKIKRLAFFRGGSLFVSVVMLECNVAIDEPEMADILYV